jgi:hypothetical protein
MKILSHFIKGTWASADFALLGGPETCCSQWPKMTCCIAQVRRITCTIVLICPKHYCKCFTCVESFDCHYKIELLFSFDRWGNWNKIEFWGCVFYLFLYLPCVHQVQPHCCICPTSKVCIWGEHTIFGLLSLPDLAQNDVLQFHPFTCKW